MKGFSIPGRTHGIEMSFGARRYRQRPWDHVCAAATRVSGYAITAGSGPEPTIYKHPTRCHVEGHTGQTLAGVVHTPQVRCQSV
jgi:hypothetical protein